MSDVAYRSMPPGCTTKWAGTFQSTGRKPCDRFGIARVLCLFVSREVVDHDISVLLDRIYMINRIFFSILSILSIM